jgi:hypothetical protein
MAAASYKLLIDWSGNGSFTDAGDDVTARTLDGRTPVTVRYGRDQSRQLSPTSPGEADFELNNISRDYSPENASSPLAGLVAPGRAVQLQATSGSTTVVFNGYLDDFTVKPDPAERSIDATCTDALGRLKGVDVSTPVYQGVRTGEAIGHLLDAAGWPTTLRDLDSGASYLPYWWVDSVDAFTALMQLVDSEGPAALATVDTQGRIVFRDRHHRLTRSASLTVQATWRASGVEPVMSSPVGYDHGWKEIVNSVSVDVPMRSISSDLAVVWSSSGQFSFPAGGIIEVAVKSTSGAFINAVPPVQDTDFTVLAGAATIALDRTSGESATLQITADPGTVLQDLQLRANALQSTSVTVTVEEPASIGKYGRRSMQSGRLPVWTNIYDAQAVLELTVGKHAERLPSVAVTMRAGGSAARLAECLTRNLSDRVHVVEPETGLDVDCFIEQIAHAVDEGGRRHVTTFGIEKIPVVVANPFTFDVAGQGFDQGQFGQVGQDNPANMFRFDTSGQGFDQGVLAT